jgi:ABC-type Fe3+-hydroxamate transport system substrate-binding protein
VPMPFYQDQLGRTVAIPEAPRRIISLVPSQTELLYDLGLKDEVIGITKFCIHPDEWFRTKIRVGGTKQLHIDKIKQLQPDLIIANKEENVKEQIEELSEFFPVWISDVNNLDDAYEMIRGIGLTTGRQKEAKSIAQDIRSGFQTLDAIVSDRGDRQNIIKPRTAYLIWKDPYMTIGRDSFIHDMMDRAGFYNVFGDKTRYPETTMEELAGKNCDIVMLSSEPYPFQEKHIREISDQLQTCTVLLVDGEMFSWYGSRLKKSASYFINLHQVAMNP